MKFGKDVRHIYQNNVTVNIRGQGQSSRSKSSDPNSSAVVYLHLICS